MEVVIERKKTFGDHKLRWKYISTSFSPQDFLDPGIVCAFTNLVEKT